MPLVDFWSHSPVRGVHPEDRAEDRLPPEACVRWDSVSVAQEHVTQLAQKSSPLRHKLHAGLFPHPFVGNVRSASVYLLFGNPGLTVNDYVDELENTTYIEYCKDNLQGLVNGFGPLLPAAEGTRGAMYWERVFAQTFRDLSKELDVPLADARAWAVSQLAVIEACAYHSCKFPTVDVTLLPSTQMALHFARGQLADRAAQDDCFILVWRRAKMWSLEDGQNIVTRESRRGAQHGYIYEGERRRVVKFLARKFRYVPANPMT